MKILKSRTDDPTHQPEFEVMEPKVQIGPQSKLYINHILNTSEQVKIVLPKIEETKSVTKQNKTKKVENKMSVIYYKVSKNRETKLFPYKENENLTHYGHWSNEEHQRFIEGYQKHGRKWAVIAQNYVKTRTTSQVTSHAQQYFQKCKINQ